MFKNSNFFLNNCLVILLTNWLVYCVPECSRVVEELSQLRQLNTYVNEFPGLYHDHFTTTWSHSSHPNALSKYDFVETLGMVMTDNRKCECAVEVVGLLDEQMGFGGNPLQPGLFGRINHKMVIKKQRHPNAIDQYLLTGEKFFCVEKYGQCGASVPLREWHVDAEYDTIMTTNTSMLGAIGVNFKGILCYIWPVDYKAGTEAPAKSNFQLNEVNRGAIGGLEMINEIECPQLNTTNGDWTFNSLKKGAGTVATLNCHPNHSPIGGSHIVVCQKSHQWMPMAATRCIECRKCTPFPSSHSAQINYSAKLMEDEEENLEFYPILTSATLSCRNDTGVSHNSADVAVCTSQGWLPSNLGQCEKVCTPLTITNGQILYTDSRGFDQISNTNGTIATGVCQPSARLINGSGSATCHNGEWSTRHLGNCEWPTCRSVENVQNGRLLYSVSVEGSPPSNLTLHYPGTKIRLHCNSNYSIHGASESVCESHGNWQPNIGHCE